MGRDNTNLLEDRNIMRAVIGICLSGGGKERAAMRHDAARGSGGCRGVGEAGRHARGNEQRRRTQHAVAFATAAHVIVDVALGR
jgi:hypothetical protein